MENNQQKRNQNTQPSRRRENFAPTARKGVYFEPRFMTDEEHETHKQKYIKLGIIKEKVFPTAVEQQTFYGPNGERAVSDVTVVFKNREETLAMRQNLIDNGFLIPKANRTNRYGRA
jgi:hypothetical protein